MMRELSQEEKDQFFRNWVATQAHRIEILQEEGFSRQEAIEMMKVYWLASLDDVASAVNGIC